MKSSFIWIFSPTFPVGQGLLLIYQNTFCCSLCSEKYCIAKVRHRDVNKFKPLLFAENNVCLFQALWTRKNNTQNDLECDILKWSEKSAKDASPVESPTRIYYGRDKYLFCLEVPHLNLFARVVVTTLIYKIY